MVDHPLGDSHVKEPSGSVHQRFTCLPCSGLPGCGLATRGAVGTRLIYVSVDCPVVDYPAAGWPQEGIVETTLIYVPLGCKGGHSDPHLHSHSGSVMATLCVWPSRPGHRDPCLHSHCCSVMATLCVWPLRPGHSDPYLHCHSGPVIVTLCVVP